MAAPEFVHLHVHTAYSLLDGAIRIPDLLARVAALEMPAVAITDHGTLFGALDFYQKATKAGIKPILGCEVYVAPGSRHERRGAAKGDNFHLVLLAMDNQGWRNLVLLVTKAHLEGFYYRPRVDKELLQELNRGLIALSSCLHGEVARNLLAGDVRGAEAAAREYAEIFPGRFYLELQANDLPEQQRVNAALLELGPKWGLPLVATNDCHYLVPEDARAHDVLLCIQTGKTINTSGRMQFHTDQLYFKSPAEMARAFPNPELLATSGEIASRCEVKLELGQLRFPVFPAAAGESMAELLRRQAKEGLEKRLAAEAGRLKFPEADYWQRLEYELQVLETKGFAGYFLVVADIVNYARKRRIPVGPGRGSAAGSLVAYALGITDLDPLAHGLFFERFLNPERMSPPDIDMDFCFERRGEIIHYVAKTYGYENVAQITTFGSMKTRQVIRDVGRALEVPYAEVDKIAKLVPEQLNITLAQALEREPRLRELRDTNPTVREILAIAEKLEGLPRHASTHAAGLVISDRPLWEYLPLYKGSKGELVTQFDMKGVEQVGLVKFDFLGLRTLTVIDQAVRLIRRHHQPDFDISRIPLDDPDTFALLQAANTAGVFQLESSGMRSLMVRLKPSTFEDVVALVALYRPGPMESGMHEDYVRRKHGEAQVTYLLPELEPILKETYGIILYQEQVMQIAAAISGYSLAEADILRRAMGKKIPEVMAAQRERFVSGAVARGVPPATAEALFNLIEKFAGYGFNKSHSAAYALIAYQTAYLKAHYPLEFLAALLTSEISHTASLARHIMEAREQGIQLLPPDINRSDRDFTVEDGKVRFGLAGVKNVGVGAILEILEARKNGLFQSVGDLLSRINLTKVNRKVLEALIQAGALDSLHPNRARLMAGLESALERVQNLKRLQAARQMSMFGETVEPEGDDWLPEAPAWEESEKLAREKEALGIYLSGHPLDAYRHLLKAWVKVAIAELDDVPDGQEVSLGVVVTAVKEKMSKRGGRLAILTVEDLTGSVEVLVFGELLDRAAPLLNRPSLPLWLKGSLVKEEQGLKIVAQEIGSLGATLPRWPERLDFRLQAATVTREQLLALKEVLRKHAGPVPAFLHFLEPGNGDLVLALPPELGLTPSENLVSEANRVFGYPVLSL
jgi:DNA polymerase-3 subunit alpha|uniref:DNA polymerase III subunit alpha n=1 Tax=Desulfobacca acetoxidans TaxID=60893 RepID=A0A7C3WHV3_9BACT